MAYQKKHILTLDNQLLTVLQPRKVKVDVDVTASVYSQ